jgi:hypothetical protein
MRIRIAVAALAVFAPLVASAQGAPTSGPPPIISTSAPAPKMSTVTEKATAQIRQAAEIKAFQRGFEISADSGRSWHADDLDVVVSPCPSSQGFVSPCGQGAPQFIRFKVRFPTITGATAHSSRYHYIVANLSASDRETFCGLDSTYVVAPTADTEVSFSPQTFWVAQSGRSSGSTMSVTCRWAVTTTLYSFDESKRRDVRQDVWSDTVSVRLHGQ